MSWFLPSTSRNRLSGGADSALKRRCNCANWVTVIRVMGYPASENTCTNFSMEVRGARTSVAANCSRSSMTTVSQSNVSLSVGLYISTCSDMASERDFLAAAGRFKKRIMHSRRGNPRTTSGSSTPSGARNPRSFAWSCPGEIVAKLETVPK